MLKFFVLLICLTFSNMCCSTGNTKDLRTHETVMESTVSLFFLSGSAGNGVIIQRIKNNTYLMLSSAHLCNLAVEIEYIVDSFMSQDPNLIDRAKKKISRLKKAIKHKLLCVPKIKQSNITNNEVVIPLGIDFDNDLAFFLFSSDKKFEISPIDQIETPKFGQEIYTYGYVFYPGFYTHGMSYFGRVGDTVTLSLNPSTKNYPTKVLQSSLGVSHGLSGSGVYTLDHNLVGIIAAEAELGTHKTIRLSFFIHPDVIKKFISSIETFYVKKSFELKRDIVSYCKSANPVLCNAFWGKKVNILDEIEKEISNRK